MQEVLSSLLMWAVSLSAYPEPALMPTLTPVTHSSLVNTLCDGRECNALAYYEDKSSTIFYDEKMNLDSSITARGFIVHELVHYLQDKAGKMADMPLPCQTQMMLEREAYLVQKEFLRQHHTMTYEVDMAIRLLGKICDRG